MNHRVRGPAVLALSLAALTACGDATGGGGGKPVPQTPAITGSVLTAGGEGVLTGTSLDQLPASLTVDGATVTPTARTATEIRFAMPAGRPCEVDGRPIAVQAGSVAHTGSLKVPGVLSMEVGESRVLTREQLATLCLQFPQGDNRYVLTALNTNFTRAQVVDTLFTVHGWTGANTPAASVSPARSIATAAHSRHEMLTRANVPRARAGVWYSYSDNPKPFDPRYATATVGDTVTWVDFFGDAYACEESRDEVLTFPVVVAATSTSGKTVLAFDPRSRYAADWTKPETRAWLTRAADMMEKWAAPAVRAAMDPNYQQIKGGGGRWWHIFRPDIRGFTQDGPAGAPQSMCVSSSEMPVTVSHDLPPQNAGQIEYLAGALIHEYAHHAQDAYAVRRWGTTVEPTREAWPIFESWAQTIQETATRLASNQPSGARFDHQVKDVPFTDFYLSPHGENPEQSLWGEYEPAGRAGFYDQGVRFLMFLRERWGDAAANTSHERFYGRTIGLPVQDATSIAGLVGLSATAALDQWALADATDDLVDPSAAAARGLPQIQSWVPDDLTPPKIISKTGNTTRRLTTGHGNYAAVYVWGGDAEWKQGVSMTFSGFGSAPFLARVTRLK